MSDNRKEAEEKMAKAIFISGDGWLSVFDLLEPSQLGLGIALISHRFNFYVDEHFKTRKWTFGIIRIGSKIRENGTNEMEIVNCYRNPLPITQKPVPKKVVGFKAISIEYIDNNSIAFLHRFCPLFASFCPINLAICTTKHRILAFILRNIWPMIAKNICGMFLFESVLRPLHKLVPSFLNECPSLRIVSFLLDDIFAEFPFDDSAITSDGQAVVKWLFTPLQNAVPKVLICTLDMDDENLASKIEAFKAAFASASSPVNFIVVMCFIPSSFADPVVPFVLTNELTREQLAFKETDKSDDCFVLVRCPIVRDASKWAKWEEEAIGWECFDQWNQILFNVDEIGDGLLDATPGSSDQQK